MATLGIVLGLYSWSELSRCPEPKLVMQQGAAWLAQPLGMQQWAVQLWALEAWRWWG